MKFQFTIHKNDFYIQDLYQQHLQMDTINEIKNHSSNESIINKLNIISGLLSKEYLKIYKYEDEFSYIQKFRNGVDTIRGLKRLEQTLQKIIIECIKHTQYNFIVYNIPEYATVKENNTRELIDEFHMYDTLNEFGIVSHVEKISDNAYLAKFTDFEEAKETAECVDKMLIENQIIYAIAVKREDKTIVLQKSIVEPVKFYTCECILLSMITCTMIYIFGMVITQN